MSFPEFLSQFTAAQLTAIYEHCKGIHIEAGRGFSSEQFDQEAQGWLPGAAGRSSEEVLAAFACFIAYHDQVTREQMDSTFVILSNVAKAA